MPVTLKGRVTEPSPAWRKWQLLSSMLLTTLTGWAASACGAAAEPAPPAQSPASESELKAAAQARAALSSQLAAAPSVDLQHCRTTAGDCLISLAELRDGLVRTHYLNGCRDPDAEKQGPCVTLELERRGSLTELTAYYKAENWCSRKLLECTAAITSNAAHVATRQLVHERQAQLETTAKGMLAASEPEFAEEKLAFVRSILPPKAQETCSAVAPAHCPDTANGARSRFDSELAKEPRSYDSERALSLYTAIRQAEADCYTPELSCLIGQLPQYGASAESEKLLQQNLSLLAKQQQTRSRLEPDAAEQCLSDGIVQYRDRIVDAYGAYVRDSVAPRLVRVQKAFVGLHETQLDCLSRLSKQRKR